MEGFSLLESILRAFALNRQEYSILAALIDKSETRTELIQIVAAVGVSDDLRKIERALDRCLDRGLVRVILPQDLEKMTILQNIEKIPSCALSLPAVSGIDYTEIGYRIFATIRSLVGSGETVGNRFVQRSQRRWLEIYATSRVSCITAALDYLKHSGNAVMKKKGRLTKSKPVRVGPWRYSNYEVFSDGYCIRIPLRF